ncbi:hypothetical protein E2562_014512 [Oryza meyeriana var. granulata]|uniref:F-box domain-containing protein n=1 Tax=Oryza meyeriana var. granulata TaxID=110450 RepID=A0A6G1EIY4_9ORYZ|nr:hypothetical protein E2562_014512 [Oryza meyeriana var. granulata]
MQQAPGPHTQERVGRRAWRALVDGRALLLPHLLPRSVHGVLLNYIDHGRPHLFSRPSSSSSATGRIDGNLSFMPNGDGAWWSVVDHCDGLVLCDVQWGSRLAVCNPATRRCAVLPPRAEPTRYSGAYLAFDPAASAPHYEVFLIPNLPEKPPPPPVRPNLEAHRRRRTFPLQHEMAGPFCLDKMFSSLEVNGAEETEVDEEFEQQPAESPPTPPSSMDDDPYSLMEWPPLPYRLEVFSSRTGQWEERAFVREGEKVTTVEDMLPLGYAYRGPRRGYSVYWQGALYVHCRGAFVTSETLSDEDFQWDSDNDDFLAIEVGGMALPVPDDVLADILRRLPPRSLAVAQCVCNTWRFLVDDRALLRPRILPHSVHGVVINYIDHRRPHLFSRPRSSSYSAATGGEIDGNLSSVPSYRMNWHVMDHCDSLLLCDIGWGDRLCVCNPATRRWRPGARRPRALSPGSTSRSLGPRRRTTRCS